MEWFPQKPSTNIKCTCNMNKAFSPHVILYFSISKLVTLETVISPEYTNHIFKRWSVQNIQTIYLNGAQSRIYKTYIYMVISPEYKKTYI